MKESLAIAKKQLKDRWLKAFNEINDFYFYEAKTVKIKYALSSRFDLKTYKNGKIKQGGKLFDKMPDKTDFHEYGFDENNFPTITKFQHSWNKNYWRGFYKNEKNVVEYLEFCLNTKMPSCIERVSLENGKKKLFQSIKINGGGTGFNYSYAALPKDEMARNIIEDKFSIISTILEFEYQDGIITKAYGVANMPGIEEFTFEDIYQYDSNKKLQQIIRYFQDGQSQIEYIKRSKKSLKLLIEELSEMFTASILNTLLKSDIRETLFCVQLNYHYCDNFWPFISIMTEEKKQYALKNNIDFLFLNYELYDEEFSNIESSKLLKETFAEFIGRIEEKENFELGRKLLLKTARLLTNNKLNGLIPVGEDFVVFPIDWTLQEDVEEILIECGVKKNTVEEWKSLEWF